jgi:GTP cyclohydrolase I
MEEKKIERLKELFEEIITVLGEDKSREGLVKTPVRVAKAYSYLTKGYCEDIDSIVNNAVFSTDNDDMVIIKNIELYSLCEHHMLPFIGKCHVAYIPRGKVLGLSKIARIVDVFSRRLQIQENLSREIAETVLKYTGAEGVGVVIEAQHLCMMMRGVEKQNSVMTTSTMLGSFRDEAATRSEFLSLIRR